jgi:folate-binding protein YgfZ
MAVTELTEKLAASGSQTGDYRGAQTVTVYSDQRAEFAGLRSAAGVYDLGWRAKIVLTGSDRVRWLNGMITNNVRDLGVNQGVYAFLLNPQGRIQSDLYAYKRGEHLLLDTDQSQVEKLLGLFDHYIIMDDVEVANRSGKLTAIGIAGPKSQEIFEAAGLRIPELRPLQLQDNTWRDIAVTIVRGDFPAVPSYEIWLAPANVGLVWDALVKAGAIPVGSAAHEMFRVALGVPAYGVDIRERDLPQETGQGRALHFSKGCYVGQEIVERIHSRGNVHRSFSGFVLRGTPPEHETRIQSEGKDVGEVTSTATLPIAGGELSVALGYIRRETAAPAKEVQIGQTKATVSPLPFARVFQQ